MGTITIRNLDDQAIERLKMRARTLGRSLEAELRELLTQASCQPLLVEAVVETDRIAAMTSKGVKQTDSVSLLRKDRGR